MVCDCYRLLFAYVNVKLLSKCIDLSELMTFCNSKSNMEIEYIKSLDLTNLNLTKSLDLKYEILWIKSRLKELKDADEGHSLNRDFTVQRITCIV